jgi:hypothetical protein
MSIESTEVYGYKVAYLINGTARFKNVNNCLDTNIYSYLETSDGQGSNLFLNAVHFFSTRVNYTPVAA